MATQAAPRVPTRTGGRRFAAATRSSRPAHPTGCAGLGGAAAADQHIDRRVCVLPVHRGQRPGRRGQLMALILVWGAAEPGPVALDQPGRLSQPARGVFVLCGRRSRRSGVRFPGRARLGGLGRRRMCCAAAGLGTGCPGPAGYLVLDDFHVISEPRVLTRWSSWCGTGAQLARGGPTRTDAPAGAPLSTGRSAGRDPATDLAFSVDEAGLCWPGTDARCGESAEGLVRHTEGWAAGLRLAAICVAAHPDPDRFVDPDQFVEDLLAEDSALTGFLVEEVFNAQPPEVRELLLSTAILDRSTPKPPPSWPVTMMPATSCGRWRTPTRWSSRSGAGGIATTRCSRRYCGAGWARVSCPDRLLAPTGRPLASAQRPAHRRGTPRRPGRRLAAGRRHRHRRAGDQRDHRADRWPVAGR